MNKRFLYRATWMPQRKMEVGQIGRFDNRKWTKEGSLADLGIEIHTSSHSVDGNMEFTSEGGVSIGTRLKGGSAQVLQHLADANADVVVDFSKENAIVFKANNVIHHQLDKKILLKDKILALWKEGRWDKDYLIVSEVFEAATTTIMVSSGSNAKIELNATGDIGGKALDLADASLGFKVANNKNIGVQVIAASKLTPLYNVIGIRKSLFGSADLVARSLEDVFVEVPFGEED
ncbi:MAG: hypothetical protein AAF599_20955 [Bacteroidota bacterium]